MKKVRKEYTNGEITEVWQNDVCMHSGICVRELSSVFVPRERPWINMVGANTEKITSTVNKCPSGAISYYYNDQGPDPDPDSGESETTIEITKNGPLLVNGNIIIKDLEGNETKRSKVTALCRCGASENKPYCDGAHKKIEFEG